MSSWILLFSIQLYADYVSEHYREPIVVFDGYGQCSTKDMMKKRQSKGKTGSSVSFTLDMHLTTSKELFLNEISNKQRFIRSLGETLKANHCHVFHDTADADLLIVKKAIVSSQTMETVIVGNDTDLLLLLIYHDPLDKNNLLFAPEPKKNSNGHIWDIKHVKN